MDSLGNTNDAAPSTASESSVSINDLPSETLLDIFSYLSPIELKDLRLVCRRWNEVASDKASWIRAFRNRFGTGLVFASVTGSEKWIPEYFGRVGTLKKWAKAKASSKLYLLVNSDFAQLDRVQADFLHDRLMTYCLYSGTVAMCTLSLGKNQVFIPESLFFSRFTAFDANWNYLCVGKDSGEIYLRNLMTATATASSRLSVTTVCEQTGRRVMAVKINEDFDKHKEKPDLLTADIHGDILFWSLAGALVDRVSLEENVFWIDSDFKTCVVAVSPIGIYVLDFATRKIRCSFAHGFELHEPPVSIDVDFGDDNVVMCDDHTVRVFHYGDAAGATLLVREGVPPAGETIVDGTLQQQAVPLRRRNDDVAGGDGRLYGLCYSDGSVGIFNLRETSSDIVLSTRVMPFTDDRSHNAILRYTKIALNSAVVAIGASPNWIHIYDAHSGEYLRECLKVSKKLTRDGVPPILKIEFSPNQQAGVVVSGDIVQYFKFGEGPLQQKKKPNTPQGNEAATKRQRHRHIRAQMDEYDLHEHQRKSEDLIADKYNGTAFDSEQEELRVAMALSASSAPRDEEFEQALAISQQEAEGERLADALDSRSTGSLSMDDDEVLRRVMELLLMEH